MTNGHGADAANGIIYGLTLLCTFLTDNYLLVMIIFGFCHVVFVYEKDKREKELHRLKIKRLMRSRSGDRREDD